MVWRLSNWPVPVTVFECVLVCRMARSHPRTDDLLWWISLFGELCYESVNETSWHRSEEDRVICNLPDPAPIKSFMYKVNMHTHAIIRFFSTRPKVKLAKIALTREKNPVQTYTQRISNAQANFSQKTSRPSERRARSTVGSKFYVNAQHKGKRRRSRALETKKKTSPKSRVPQKNEHGPCGM